jgi:hypothetical protein
MRRGAAAAVAAMLGAALWTAGPASASATPAAAGATPAGASVSATTWWAQQAPAPPKAERAGLSSVSCPARGICTAVGYSSSRSLPAGSTLAERLDGGTWTIQPTPHPAGSGLSWLTGVSCPAVTYCIAVGQTGELGPQGEQWDGTGWTLQSMPLPPDVANGGPEGVSCISSTDCIAVGYYYPDEQDVPMPLAEQWDGTGWTIQTMPAGVGNTVLNGVSCPAATDCVAVGANGADPVMYRWNGSAWAVQDTPQREGELTSVSCVSPAVCTAVGINAHKAVAEQWNGTAWTRTKPTTADGVLSSVSCATATSCFAVGTGTSAEHWNGANWTAQALNVLPSEAASLRLSGVMCRPGSYCTAVGSANQKKLPVFHK